MKPTHIAYVEKVATGELAFSSKGTLPELEKLKTLEGIASGAFRLRIVELEE